MNPILIKRKWVDGEFKEVKYPLLSGYIFLFSNEQMDPTVVHRLGGVQRVLQYGDKIFALAGYDEQLARWLARYDGRIGISQAIRVGNRIQVVEGPMKDNVGRILKVDMRKQCAKMEFQFCGSTFTVWTNFVWVETPPLPAGVSPIGATKVG